MSDQPQSRGKLVVLLVLLVACGGVLTWVLTRPPAGEVSESIEDKASRLTERVQQAEGELDFQNFNLTPNLDENNLVNKRKP